MSSQTRQSLEVLLSLLPWIAFIAAILWCSAKALLDDLRGDRVGLRRSPRSLE